MNSFSKQIIMNDLNLCGLWYTHYGREHVIHNFINRGIQLQIANVYNTCPSISSKCVCCSLVMIVNVTRNISLNTDSLMTVGNNR